MTGIKLGWGLHDTGRMLHIADADRGKQCNCICPDCKNPLIARQGEKVVWHFAHAVPIECNGESVLHRAAKQAIVDAANQQESISLPDKSGIVTLRSSRGKSFQRTWSMQPQNLRLFSAKQEVKIRPDLIADVLTQGEGEQELAIEIYVTHAKTEVEADKYEDVKLSCIEIDLSEIPWNSTSEEIKDAVLQKAPKKWIYCDYEYLLIEQTKKELRSYISNTERLDFVAVEDFCKKLGKQGNRILKLFDWPIITGTYRKKGKSGLTVIEHKTQPKVTILHDDWKRDHNVFSVTGLVNGKTRLPIHLVLRGTPNVSFDIEKPALVIWLEIYDGEIVEEFCELEWIGIDTWISKLEQIAKKRCEEEFYRNEKKHSDISEFSEKFRNGNDLFKLQFIAEKLNIKKPEKEGSYLPNWNTTWSVWKSLVWYYKISRKTGFEVSLKSIADDAWISELLDWPEDQASIDARQKNLWFWFKDLEKVGIARHQGRQRFLIAEQLPKNFIPWHKVP
ncbi:hypothetical protein NBRC116494_22210 [Aurantivibrio plasticivorans]